MFQTTYFFDKLRLRIWDWTINGNQRCSFGEHSMDLFHTRLGHVFVACFCMRTKIRISWLYQSLLLPSKVFDTFWPSHIFGSTETPAFCVNFAEERIKRTRPKPKPWKKNFFQHLMARRRTWAVQWLLHTTPKLWKVHGMPGG